VSQVAFNPTRGEFDSRAERLHGEQTMAIQNIPNCEICGRSGNFIGVRRMARTVPAMPSQHSNEKVPRSIWICKECIAENDRIEANEHERRKST